MTRDVTTPRPALEPGLAADDVEARHGVVLHGARTMYFVKQLEMLLRSRMEPIARSVSITIPQYTVLSILSARPGLSSAELARSTFVSAQAANELVNGLYGRGLILRRPSPEHAKILRLRLSKKGEDLLASCAEGMQELEAVMLGALRGDDAHAFHDGLRLCIGALEGSADA